ncbi:hypothetical protein COCSADRAFT_293232, partial [Bipolaris sorokiniana ND90Pr]
MLRDSESVRSERGVRISPFPHSSLFSFFSSLLSSKTQPGRDRTREVGVYLTPTCTSPSHHLHCIYTLLYPYTAAAIAVKEST